jgi:hypothetical protein
MKISIEKDKLKKEILVKNNSIKKLNYILNNESNEHILEESEQLIIKEKKELNDLIVKFHKESANERMVKAAHKKELVKLRETLIDFSKMAKDPLLKKGIYEINNIMNKMNKYIDS